MANYDEIVRRHRQEAGAEIEENFLKSVPARWEDYRFSAIDATVPETLRGMLIDKGEFAKTAFQKKLTQAEAAQLYEDYIASAVSDHNELLVKLKKEDEMFGPKSTPTKEVVDKSSGYYLTPEEAKGWINQIMSDRTHPYLDLEGKATQPEHDRAVAFVNRLLKIVNGEETSIEGWLAEHDLEQKARMQELYGGTSRDLIHGSSVGPQYSEGAGEVSEEE